MIKFISAEQLVCQRNTAQPWRVLDISAAPEPLAGTHRIVFDQIVHSEGETVGLLPTIDTLNAALGHTGISREQPIVVLDDQQGLSASRLAWTLAVCGFTNLMMVDGGRAAVMAAGWPLGDAAPAEPTAPLSFIADAAMVTAEAIRDHLAHPGWRFLDARSQEEFEGQDRRSRHAGHIPGAIHCDWRAFFRSDAPDTLRPDEEILALLAEHGITRENSHTLVVYCQSHRRSSLMFSVLKHLGFTDVRGYPGAWSDWGNRDDLPIESLATPSV